MKDTGSHMHANTLKLSTLWHICHGSAPFDLLITINLYQKQVSVLLRFKNKSSDGHLLLGSPRVDLTVKGADVCTGGFRAVLAYIL